MIDRQPKIRETTEGKEGKFRRGLIDSRARRVTGRFQRII